MRTCSSPPLIIMLSVSFYQHLLYLGPADYREDYEEAMLQVFRQCRRDAYRQHRAPGVLTFWPLSFSDAALGMLAERFSVERMRFMFPSLRRSLIITVSAFVVFGLAYLLRIIDPLPPFEAIGRLQPETGLTYMLIRDSADLAFLLVVGSGLLLLGLTLKQAVATRQRDVLFRFGRSLGVVLVIGAMLLTTVGGCFATWRGVRVRFSPSL